MILSRQSDDLETADAIVEHADLIAAEVLAVEVAPGPGRGQRFPGKDDQFHIWVERI